METSFLDNFMDGFNEFIALFNWVYIISFILIGFILNEYSDAKNKAQWLNWLKDVPRILRATVVGFLLMPVFYWLERMTTREELFSLFISFIFSLAIYKYGIQKALEWLLSKQLNIKK